MDDEELRQAFARIEDGQKSMEARLMLRINTGTESVLNRLTTLEGEVRDLRSEHSVTRATVLALPVTVIGALEKPLLERIRGMETRITKLEKPD
jgi:hypothetical protein